MFRFDALAVGLDLELAVSMDDSGSWFCLDSTVQVLSISFPLAARVKANLCLRVFSPLIIRGKKGIGVSDGFRASQPRGWKLDGRLAESIFNRHNLSLCWLIAA